tara:strand:+ start:3066 stop:3875 length:810 start_codon:yes stop_codon:yes gene_type:complete
MKIIRNKKRLKTLIQKDKNLGFVPTMGAIHEGHMSLIRKSIKQCDKTIISIFVNKPQFNKKSDFNSYPRDLNKDISTLRKLKINYLYLPTSKQIYPYGPNKRIKINKFEKKLCGQYRPGHFKSVVDVVDKFIEIINPKKIYFGEKDMQQLKIITDYVKKKHVNLQVIPCKTVRDKNGVALSSRNLLLSKNEYNIASKIYNFIKNAKNKIINKKISINHIKDKINKFKIKKIEYITILDVNKLIKPYVKKKKYRIFISYYLGKTRLIDNI